MMMMMMMMRMMMMMMMMMIKQYNDIIIFQMWNRTSKTIETRLKCKFPLKVRHTKPSLPLTPPFSLVMGNYLLPITGTMVPGWCQASVTKTTYSKPRSLVLDKDVYVTPTIAVHLELAACSLLCFL
jgi:hypothetical protein